MSNYLSLYADPNFAPRPRFTPKQRRRFQKKTNRDLILGAARNTGAIHPGNPTKPKGLSGHPGRRRAQLGGRTPLRGSFERYVAILQPKQAEPEAAPVVTALDYHRMDILERLAPAKRPKRLVLVSRAAYLAQSERAA